MAVVRNNRWLGRDLPLRTVLGVPVSVTAGADPR